MSEAIPLSVVKELFAHNYWARDRQLQACSALTDEQFVQPMGSGFSSVRDTLVHLVGVEWIWLERWRGRSPRSLLSPSDFASLEAVTGRWRDVESGMRTYLSGLTDEAIQQPITYVNLKGATWTYVLQDMVLHVLQHQGYHRGQVSTLLRQLGVQPPPVDFLNARDAGVRSF